MVTAQALIELFMLALSESWGYILGKWGQVWTQKMQDAATNEMARKYGQQWVGRKVADCSGLFRWALKQLGVDIPHGSNMIWKGYLSRKGKITDGTALRPGTAVFKVRNGTDRYHIGLYIGGGRVIEARGTKTGVVASSVSDWDEWGELKCVRYEGDGELIVQTVKFGSKGETVKELQTKLGVTADGIFGKNTEAAVRDFQMKNGLDADGIVGPKTWAVLNGDLAEISSSRIVSTDEDEELEGFENEALKTQILGIIYDAVKQIEEALK